jgi:Zn-dependent protease/predicted transcriptional regulator
VGKLHSTNKEEAVMKWSIRFARIAGIDLKIHLTFLIFLAWIGFTYYANGGSEAAVRGVLFIVLLFACVLLHELGHALTARRFGIHTPDITLLPIGGIARLERIPDQPKQELLIAIAGPLVNLIIAGLLILFLHQRATASDLAQLNSPQVAMLAKLASVNLFLALFNLIPAFPMDGGRILRALLAMRLNYARATQIAARVGQGLAFVFGFFGLLYNPLLIFIALFVYLGATQEAGLAQIKDISAGLPVAEAMMTAVKTLPAGAKLEEAAEAVLRTSQHEFPVVDDAGGVLGILLREDIIKALRQRGGEVPVTQVMHRPPAVHPGDPLDEAFAKMEQCGCPALPVVDTSGKFVGLLTPENVGEMMILKSLRPTEGKPSWRLAHA